jgi:hypothetical protein
MNDTRRTGGIDVCQQEGFNGDVPKRTGAKDGTEII